MKIDKFRSVALMKLKGEIEILMREETPVVINRDLFDYKVRRFFRAIAEFFGMARREPPPHERRAIALKMFRHALMRRYGEQLAHDIIERLGLDKLTGDKIIQAIDAAAEMLASQLRALREGNDQSLKAWLPAADGALPEAVQAICKELFLEAETFAGEAGQGARDLYRERMESSIAQYTDAHTSALPPNQAAYLARQELEQIKSELHHGKVLLYQRDAGAFLNLVRKAEIVERQGIKILLASIHEGKTEEDLLKALRDFDRRVMERMVMTRSNFVRRMMEIPDAQVEGANEWINRRYVAMRDEKLRQWYALLRKVQLERWAAWEIAEMSADQRYETLEQALSANGALRALSESRWGENPGASPDSQARRLAFAYLQVIARDLMRCLKRLNHGFPDRVYSFSHLGEAHLDVDHAIERFAYSFYVNPERAAKGAWDYVVEIAHGFEMPGDAGE